MRNLKRLLQSVSLTLIMAWAAATAIGSAPLAAQGDDDGQCATFPNDCTQWAAVGCAGTCYMSGVCCEP